MHKFAHIWFKSNNKVADNKKLRRSYKKLGLTRATYKVFCLLDTCYSLYHIPFGPPRQAVCQILDISTRTFTRSINSLISLNFIVKEKKGNNYRGLASRYRIKTKKWSISADVKKLERKLETNVSLSNGDAANADPLSRNSKNRLLGLAVKNSAKSQKRQAKRKLVKRLTRLADKHHKGLSVDITKLSAYEYQVFTEICDKYQ